MDQYHALNRQNVWLYRTHRERELPATFKNTQKETKICPSQKKKKTNLLATEAKLAINAKLSIDNPLEEDDN